MFRKIYAVSAGGLWLLFSNTPLFLDFQWDVNWPSNYYKNRGDVVNSIVSERDYKAKSMPVTGVVLLTPKAGDKQYYIHKFWEKLEDFSLKFRATSPDYSKIKKESINISLFKNPAWSSSSGEDEYQRITESIDELFGDLDEEKTKQLLLSLSIRRHWKPWGTNGHDFWPGHKLTRPSGLDDLKDLKIKYFREYKDLKDYVHRKVKVCTEQQKPCYATHPELDILDQDKSNFF